MKPDLFCFFVDNGDHSNWTSHLLFQSFSLRQVHHAGRRPEIPNRHFRIVSTVQELWSGSNDRSSPGSCASLPDRVPGLPGFESGHSSRTTWSDAGLQHGGRPLRLRSNEVEREVQPVHRRSPEQHLRVGRQISLSKSPRRSVLFHVAWHGTFRWRNNDVFLQL